MSPRIVAGRARNRPLRTLPGLGLRPTSERVRSALFAVLGRRVVGARVLDLYAGTGALGLEALSRGARWADFVEADPRACRLIRENLAGLGMEGQGRVLCRRVERALPALEGPYDLVLADPPYDLWPLDPLLTALGRPGLLAPSAWVVVEHSARRDPPERAGPLVRRDRRTYGDTALSFYTREQESDGPSDVPGVL